MVIIGTVVASKNVASYFTASHSRMNLLNIFMPEW